MMAELLESQKMEVVGRLAGGIAHDFNNMMVAVKALSTLGKDEVDEKGKLYTYFNNIHLASQRAVELARQLSIFSRSGPVQFDSVCLNSVVGDLLVMLPPLVGEDIFISSELEPDLSTVLADKGNLTQVIMNLAINARDAMESGGVLTIRTSNVVLDEKDCEGNIGARPGSYVRFSITDTGCGMDASTMEHIYEPFYTTKEFGKGTGLGLSVAYGIVNSHNGWIGLKSSPGKGATFNVYLPAVDEEKVIAFRGKGVTAGKPSSGQGERVLIVEDEELVRTATRTVLEQKGYSVVEAEDTRQALDILDRDEAGFDLAIIDVVLPDRSGLDLAAEFGDLRPAMKIIMMSGYLNDKSKMHTILERGLRFIAKPYDVPEFLQAVRETIGPAG